MRVSVERAGALLIVVSAREYRDVATVGNCGSNDVIITVGRAARLGIAVRALRCTVSRIRGAIGEFVSDSSDQLNSGGELSAAHCSGMVDVPADGFEPA